MTNTLPLMKNIGLFFASPFIALAYVAAFPFVGAYLLINIGREARSKRLSNTL